MTPNTDKTLQLHPDDNVVVCTVSFSPDIGIGHKLAGQDIAPGDAIIKYGVPIGTATKPIRAGEHVHMHNMKSNYISTYLRE